MAYTAGFSVNVGDPTKASDVTTLAANDDYLKAAVDAIMADSATPTSALKNGVTATTQSASDNSTKVATTAYADAAGVSLSGSTDNTVATVTGANALAGEANLTFSSNNLNVIGTAGVGLARTFGTLHVQTADSTVSSAHSVADDLVIENNATGGLSILTPNDAQGYLAFGDPQNNVAGQLYYDHDATKFVLRAEDGLMSFLNSGSLSVGTTSWGGSEAVGSAQFYKDANNFVRIWDNATATLYMQANGANAPTTAMKNSDSDSLDITSFQRTNAGATILGQVRNGLMAITGAPNGVMAIGTSNSKNLVFGTNNSPNLYLNTNGHLGVNVSDPQSLIEVSQDSASAQVDALRLTNERTQGYGAKMTFRQGDTVVGSVKADNQTNAIWAMRLGTYTKETLLTLADNGKVGINITDPEDYTDASGAVLVVGNTSSTTTRSGVSIITDTSGIGRICFGDGAGDPNQWKGVIQYTQSSDTMGFACNGQAVEMSLVGGNLGIAMTPGGSHKLDVTGSAGLSTGTAWTNTSDTRIKKDVATITGATAKLKQLRPVSFRYTDQYLSVHSEIDGSKTYHSFIADEYESVFPDAVSVQGDLVKITPATADVAEVSETLLTDLKQYTPHDLQMFVVAAVQELDARIAALEAA